MGQKKQGLQKGQLCIFQYIHELIKATNEIIFLIFIYNKCNKIIFLASYNIFNSVKERILKRRGN